MKKLFLALACALLSALPAAPAAALQLIYIFPGVADDGGADNVGLATSFVCSSVSSAPVTVQYVVRNLGGVAIVNKTLEIPAFGTRTVSTHFTLYSDDLVLGPPGSPFPVDEGMGIIQASSTAIFCTARLVNAGVFAEGITLSPVRFNPYPGATQ